MCFVIKIWLIDMLCYKERDRELEILKEAAQRDSVELRIHFNNELSNARKLARLSDEKNLKLQQEIHSKDLAIQQLR